MRRVQPLRRQPVRFAHVVTVYYVPYDDRRSPWMTVAADRHRFERRIRHVENILRPVMLRKAIDQMCGTFANVNIRDS